MSYRSFKRALGETSLERKCRFLFAACLLVLICGSFGWYSFRTEQQIAKNSEEITKIVSDESHRTCRGLVDSILISFHWEKSDRGDDWAKSVSGFLDSQTYHPTLIVPDGKENLQDSTERGFVKYFQELAQKEGDKFPPSDEPPKFRERRVRVDDKLEYQYYQGVRAKKDCNECHKAWPRLNIDDTKLAWLRTLKTGDLAAVVKITIPDDETQKALEKNRANTNEDLNWNRAILLSTAFVTVFLAMIASYVIVRYVVVKPLKHLRDVSDEISHGNTSLRADIHTGDEFEELGLAFNRMVRHLTTIQDELRNVNHNLDGKVDELAQANMKLYEMNRLKSDFLATMSHELRTPLNSIIGFSDVLGSISSLDDKQKRYVKNIQTSGNILLEMINDILDLAKIESGKMDVRLSEFRIEPIVGALCDMARPLTERKNIDLDIDIEPGLGEMFQDQAKVQQILNNLLSNAIKFTPEGGRITVSIKAGPRENMVLQVADTGVGISDEDQVTIFEKFRQGQAVLASGDAMTREYSGTGLGLSIVKELCKLLGGEISLQSELGKGSTFTIELPWTCPDQPKAADSLDGIDRSRQFEMSPSAAPGGAVVGKS